MPLREHDESLPSTGGADGKDGRLSKPWMEDASQLMGPSASGKLYPAPALDSIRHTFTVYASSIYLLLLIFSYSFCTLACMVLMDETRKESMAQFRNSIPDSIYDRALWIYSTMLLFDTLAILLDPTSKKTSLILLDFAVKLAATLTNLIVVTGAANVLTRSDGKLVNLQRYIQWTHTTPTMLVMMGCVADYSFRQLLPILLCNQVMIISGAVAAACVGTMSTLNTVLSFASFVPVLIGLRAMFTRMIANARRNGSVSDVWGVHAIMYPTLTIWSLFGVVFLLGHYDIVDLTAYELLMSACDFFAKALFSNSILLRNTKSIEMRQWAIMRTIELASKEKVIIELKDLVAQKERFMSSISHELRTPLNGLIGISDGLLNNACGALGADVRSQLTIIRKSGLRLLALINDIMDAAALRRSLLSLTKEPVLVRELLADVIDVCKPLLQPGVELVNLVPWKCVVCGDTGRIVQILNNLVGNATKFTSHGRVRIVAKRSLADPSYWAISVSDTGIGIPRDKFADIFLPFTQVDQSISRMYGGSGLGLSIVKELVLSHGGTISVESELHKGSTFTFSLPGWDDKAAGAADSTANTSKPSIDNIASEMTARSETKDSNRTVSTPSPPKEAADDDAPKTSPGREVQNEPLTSDSLEEVHDLKPFHHAVHSTWQVLSVDDDEINQGVVDLTLKQDGYVVVRKMSGAAALAYLRACCVFPDIILLDVAMPGMSGYTVCMLIRQCFPKQEVPIIMVSAKASEDNVIQGLHSGCDDYLTKPFDRQELKARIAVHLNDIVPRVESGALASAEAGTQGPSPGPADTSSPSTPMVRIAVIDIFQVGVMALERILQMKMFQLEEFQSLAALEERRARFRPHVLLMSISSDMDIEKEVADVRRLVGDVVLILAYEMDNRELMVRGLQAGADDAVQVPILRFGEVVARISAHVRRYTRRRSLRRGADPSQLTLSKMMATVLPAHTVEQIKNSNSVIADSYAHMCILVCLITIPDLEKTSAHNVMVLLNKVYHTFDMFLASCGMLRILAPVHMYVAVSEQGTDPRPSPESAAKVLQMAAQMFESAHSILDPTTMAPIQLRIAIHASKMVGGVVFSRFPQYCMLGPGLGLTQTLAEHCSPDAAVATADFVESAPRASRDMAVHVGRVVSPSGAEVGVYLLKMGGYSLPQRAFESGKKMIASFEQSNELLTCKIQLEEAKKSIKRYTALLEDARGKAQSHHLSKTVYRHLQGVMQHLVQENQHLKQQQATLMEIADVQSWFAGAERHGQTADAAHSLPYRYLDYERDEDLNPSPGQAPMLPPSLSHLLTQRLEDPARWANAPSTSAPPTGPAHDRPWPHLDPPYQNGHGIGVPRAAGEGVRGAFAAPSVAPFQPAPQIEHNYDGGKAASVRSDGDALAAAGPSLAGVRLQQTPADSACATPAYACEDAWGLEGSVHIQELHQELQAMKQRLNVMVPQQRPDGNAGLNATPLEPASGTDKVHRRRSKKGLSTVFGSWAKR